MAGTGCEEISCTSVHFGSTMNPDNQQLAARRGAGMHSTTGGGEVMYPPNSICKGGVGGDMTDTQGRVDIITHSSHAPLIGDVTYGSPCSCFLYGVCPVLPMSDGWDGVMSSEGKVEGKGLEEGGHLPDYIYQYPPSGYLPFPPMYPPPPPGPVPLTHQSPNAMPATPVAPTVTPAPSLIVVSPSSSSSSSSPPPTKVPKKEEEGQDSPSMTLIGLKNYQEVNHHCPRGGHPPAAPSHPTLPPAGVAAPPPFSHAPTGASPHPFTEESKMGVFGADGCWYALSNMQNVNGTDHHNQYHHLPAAPLNSPVHKASLCFSYFHPNHSTLIPPLTHSYRDPATYVTPSTSESPATSSSSSSALSAYPTSSLNLSSSPSGQSEAGQNGLLYYNYYQHLNLPTDVFGKPRLLSSFRKEGKMSLEDLWMNHMSVLFKHLPDEWVLSPAQPDRKVSSNWYTFRDLAKVRFYCKTCNDGWTSMYGVVVFHYRWNKRSLQGQILYKVAGQKCGGTCNSETFELPLWYPEEAQKVITNLYYKIAGQYYNLVTPHYIKTRRFGRPASHHNRNLCEGCVQGLCKMDPAASDIQ